MVLNVKCSDGMVFESDFTPVGAGTHVAHLGAAVPRVHFFLELQGVPVQVAIAETRDASVD